MFIQSWMKINIEHLQSMPITKMMRLLPEHCRMEGGVFIQIPEKKVVSSLSCDLPHQRQTTRREVRSITRNLVVVGKNSEVTLVEKFDSIGTNPNFSNLVTEIIVAEKCRIKFL